MPSEGGGERGRGGRQSGSIDMVDPPVDRQVAVCKLLVDLWAEDLQQQRVGLSCRSTMRAARDAGHERGGTCSWASPIFEVR